MKFGRIPLSQAAGAILAHSVAARGAILKKGRRLAPEDVATLAAAGIEDVMAAELEPGDVAEDAAAMRIARAIAGANLRIADAFTGRVNLFADAAGLVSFDREALIALNRVDEGLTVATLEAFARVAAGQMVATVKIIPFALAGTVVDEAEAIGRKRLRIGVCPFAPRRAGLVLTRLPQTKESVLRKREQTMERRLAALGCALAETLRVAHEVSAVAQAIRHCAAAGLDPILVFGASAISDRSDVIPLAVGAAGGEVVHLGMPVDPGNLLMLGRGAGGEPVIGVPSCAGSPKENGFDWVLERICAGLPVGREEIVAMAPGGLLMEIESRPQPRAGLAEAAPRRAARIAAIVLAAGRSTRMAPLNKLTEEVAGRAIVRHSAEAALASKARPVVIVTGHAHEAVAEALAGLDVRLVHNPSFADGLSTSLAKGIEALPAGIDGALVMLGDMPGVTGADLDRLIAAFAPKEGRSICVPVAGGKRGNPVLWGAHYFEEMRQIRGDTGARHLIGLHGEEVVEVACGEATLADVDTPRDLAKLRTT